MSDYGIAVDIGTTTVSMSLVDKSNRRSIRSLSFNNPQEQYGEDVITRIKHQLGKRDVCDLTKLIREAISDGVTKLLAISNTESSEISEIIIVGNTPMHHIFFDLPIGSLLKEPYTDDNTASIEVTGEDIGLNLPQANCYAPPLIESFVGSDALGVVIGFGLAFNVYPSLTLDIGTNSEIFVQAYERIWIASAASGPAFEGMSLTCGMKAVEGAIDKTEYIHPSRTLSVKTIGNSRPIGICGIGAISALSELRRANWITKEGSINRTIQSEQIYTEESVTGILLDDSNPNSPVFLSQMDIRMLQQSKAAIRTVIELLLQESNCDPTDIKNLYITGAFGNGLDINSAINIGMLPSLPNLVGMNQQIGGALSGAVMLVWSEYLRNEIDDIYKSIKYIDMMNHPIYDELHSRFSLFP